MPSSGELRDELAAVRKGRGLQEPHIRDRMGPILRRLSGVEADTPHSEARRALTSRLGGAADDLPEDLRLAARIMFAFAGAGGGQRFLRQRYEALAQRWNCDFRTVQRRCDEALVLICDQLDGPFVPVAAHGPGVFDTDSWYVERFTAVVLLDRTSPEALEERSIVSMVDGLQRVGLAFGLPRHPDEKRRLLDLSLGTLHGARSDSVEQVSDSLFIQWLTFPRPLRRGERHVYARKVRLPADQAMVPRFIHLVVRRCDTFELRVKFSAGAAPSVAWVVSKMPEMAYSDHRPGTDRVTPDRLGEISVRFTDLQRGFGYGLAWLPGTGSTPAP